MTWILVLEIPVVMAFGFVLGRVWPLHEVRSVWVADYEAEMGDFRPPPYGPIPTEGLIELSPQKRIGTRQRRS